MNAIAASEGRAFLQAQAYAARSPLDRRLRAYFLLMQDAQRARYAFRYGERVLAGVELDGVAAEADTAARMGLPGFRPLADRCFAVAGRLIGRAGGVEALVADLNATDTPPPGGAA